MSRRRGGRGTAVIPRPPAAMTRCQRPNSNFPAKLIRTRVQPQCHLQETKKALFLFHLDCELIVKRVSYFKMQQNIVELNGLSPLIYLSQERLVVKITKRAYLIEAISCFKEIIAVNRESEIQMHTDLKKMQSKYSLSLRLSF